MSSNFNCRSGDSKHTYFFAWPDQGLSFDEEGMSYDGEGQSYDNKGSHKHSHDRHSPERKKT
jgi:hypothetical protein